MSSPASKGTLDDYFLKGGRHVWIEMKVGSNKPTRLQWLEIEDIRAHGGEAHWANSLEQVTGILSKTYAPLAILPPQEQWML